MYAFYTKYLAVSTVGMNSFKLWITTLWLVKTAFLRNAVYEYTQDTFCSRIFLKENRSLRGDTT